MMILIVFILGIVGLVSVRQWTKYQRKVVYWKRVNKLEAQRKEQILRTALKKQQLINEK
ncbi:hypothetical protein IGI39_001499 [Enterococcus sp. AZ135]|uniref:hypothetical protein n=1 Tax=unclassified Enterococcus TaxID=2608891 RepID=UPI003F1E61F1